MSIGAVNDAPVATDGTAAVNAGASAPGILVANDLDSASLSYSLVANGAKGVATITNAATGAYTYAAGVGSSGPDTFTFQASEGSVASNVATVTVTITPPPVCAPNVTSSLTTTRGSLRLDRKTGHHVQKGTLKNVSSTAIAGPISFVLDGLTACTRCLGPSCIEIAIT